MTGAVDLEALMARYVGGDIEAFDALYTHVAPRVFSYLVSMCRNRDLADDLCQIAFLKVHRARDGWILGAPVLPWIMAIARNAFLDDARSRSRSQASVSPTGDLPEQVADDDPLRDLADQQEVAITNEALAEALEKINALQREAFLLTKRSGLSIKEAALVLGASESAVKLRVHRASHALRASLLARREEDNADG